MKIWKEKGVLHRIDGPAFMGQITLTEFFSDNTFAGHGVTFYFNPHGDSYAWFLHGVGLSTEEHGKLAVLSEKDRLIELLKMYPHSEHVYDLLSEIDPHLAHSIKIGALFL